MARQLKRWESPRREGRNNKGKGGSARQRQRRKQFQVLRQKLKEQSKDQNHERGSAHASPSILMGQRLATLTEPLQQANPVLEDFQNRNHLTIRNLA